MKKTDKTTKFMQQGGLMIEALAMLGLIAVVTPTMYKKSAERTLEVEDINTATTVRTYMNAAEAYIANNYGDLMVNQFSVRDETTGRLTPVASGSKVVSLTKAQLAPYLPYKFDTDRSLYDYNTPTVSIVNNGTNLTAFALFPAKQSAANGIGQERTARIASLVGANGGYMPDTTTARGVGGLWSLDNDTVKKMFGDGDKNAYSLVAASSNVISDVSGGEMDNDKYLQRTLEGNPNDPESYKDQLWRNTMHTDLYMGNHLPGETQSIASTLEGRNSIRDVKSLIIGAEKAPMKTEGEGDDAVTTETKNNGLYIAGTDGNDYADAYIGGALRATAEQFVVTSRGKFNRTDGEVAMPQMVFGKRFGEGDKFVGYSFEVDVNGDIYDFGRDGVLFNRFKSEYTNHKDASGHLQNIIDIGDGVIEMSRTALNSTSGTVGKLSMHIMDDDTFMIDENVSDSNQMEISMLMNGYRGVDNQLPSNAEVTGDNAGKYGHDSAGNYIGPKYNESPKFPVRVGSNMKVEGVMAAGQVDTQVLRTASLTTGSEKIDDEYKWLEVDEKGVRMRDPNPNKRNHKDVDYTDIGTGTSMILNDKQIGMRVGLSKLAKDIESLGSTGVDDHYGLLVLADTNNAINTTHLTGRADYVKLQGHSFEIDATQPYREDDKYAGYGSILLQNRKISMKFMGNLEDISAGEPAVLLLSGRRENNEDTSYKEYYVIQQDGHRLLQDANFDVSRGGSPVFSVRGNDLPDTYDERDESTTSSPYDVAAHGNTLFTSNSGEKDVNNEPRGEIKYMSVGKYNSDAGVSIMADGKESSEATKNVLVIDQSEEVDSTELPDNDIVLRQYSTTGAIPGVRLVHIAKYPDKGEPGTVYIRKGMINIANEGGIESDGSRYKAYLAHEGSGVVRASRFVANNVDYIKDKNGNFVKNSAYSVPTNLRADEFKKYNGAGRTRYDTYMVNPAYTSVMNDIKLTSRGGARLSDVLPDFINKGIYVANNTNKNVAKLGKVENTTTFVFNGWDTNNASAYPTATGETEEADVSAYLGQVPAPQCPPGYGRVITVAPISFKMAQAGSIEHIENGEIKKLKVTEAQGPAKAFKSKNDYEELVKNLENGNYVPTYNNLRASLDGQGTLHMDAPLPPTTGTITSGSIDALLYNTNFNVTSMSNNFPIKMCDQNQTITDGEKCALLDTYVLSSNVKDGFKPILFQQSTYLKTAVVPLCSKSKTYFGMTSCPKDGEYHQGWAVLMGFIYPKSQYQGVIESIRATALATEISTNETWYWNIFPVRKGSLEAYATVYCFYDRTNILRGYTDAAATEQKDGYDYMDAATSFTPTDSARREKLNDPTLKYDELW